MKSTKGFTLVELIIVIVIVAILSIVSVNYYQYSAEKARATEAVSVLRTIADANIHYYLEYGVWCEDISFLPIIIEGEKMRGWDANRIQHKNYVYSATGGSVHDEIAIAQKVPFGTKYAIYITIPNNLNDKKLYKMKATVYSKATEIEKRIVKEINSKGKL